MFLGCVGGGAQGYLQHVASLSSTDVDGAGEDVDSVTMACTDSAVNM